MSETQTNLTSDISSSIGAFFRKLTIPISEYVQNKKYLSRTENPERLFDPSENPTMNRSVSLSSNITGTPSTSTNIPPSISEALSKKLTKLESKAL